MSNQNPNAKLNGKQNLQPVPSASDGGLPGAPAPIKLPINMHRTLERVIDKMTVPLYDHAPKGKKLRSMEIQNPQTGEMDVWYFDQVQLQAAQQAAASLIQFQPIVTDDSKPLHEVDSRFDKSGNLAKKNTKEDVQDAAQETKAPEA